MHAASSYSRVAQRSFVELPAFTEREHRLWLVMKSLFAGAVKTPCSLGRVAVRLNKRNETLRQLAPV
jgi:hypothetical protein